MAVCIRLDGFEQLAAIFGFDSNVSAFDWSSVGILDNAFQNRRRGPCSCSKNNQSNTTDSKRFDKHKLTLRPKKGRANLRSNLLKFISGQFSCVSRSLCWRAIS